MTWTIEYYEQTDGTQPAEVFEDELERDHPKLLGKLLRALQAVEAQGARVGGGLVEKCSGYPGLWEIRVIHSQTLARDLFGFDGQRVVLLHGYVKRGGDAASKPDLNRANTYLQDYKRTHRISPEEAET